MTKLMLGRHLFVWPWSAVPPGLAGMRRTDGTRRATSTSLSLGLGFESWGGHSGPAHSG